MTELKPCPFCGGAALLIEKDILDLFPEFKIRCGKCRLTMETPNDKYYRCTERPGKLIEKWNTRA